MYKDISIIIMAFNEEKIIRRAIESALNLTPYVYIIDQYSVDNTLEIANSYHLDVYQYKWTADSTWSTKLNWSLKNIPFKTEWIMRLDADEFLTDDFVNNLNLDKISTDINAISINRRLYFLGKWMRYGGNYPISMIRIVRKGKAFFENCLIDEHVVLKEGRVGYLNIDIIDDPFITLSDWVNKHNRYSDLIALESLTIKGEINRNQFDKATFKRKMNKQKYNYLPKYWRALALFLYRYILRLGFLDGKEGFLWAFLQSLWYRILCDAKMEELSNVINKKIRIPSL